MAIADEIFPAVRRVTLLRRAEMGVAVDGSEHWWPGGAEDGGAPELPVFGPYQSRPAQYVEVFNRGTAPFDFHLRTGAPWLVADRTRGRVSTQTRVTFRVDWTRAPEGVTRVPVTVTGPGGREVVVRAVVDRPRTDRSRLTGFVEANGYVSIGADHFHRAVGRGGVTWRRIPGIGRTGAGVEPFPAAAPRQTPGGTGPRLEYRLSLFTTGPVTVWAYLSPRNNTLASDGLTYAVSFDDDAPRSVNITKATGSDDGTMNPQWARNTSGNVNRTGNAHRIGRAGTHVLKFWMVDPTVVPQNLVVDTGGLKPSYLGPPESLRLS
ncbi:hypothetical protein [Streptomyces sp. NPDC058330]|uniref:hypothetical protein n=1 Tax=Streptomyces sp. NPDC058330 TaxID=3346449 RepID=UPI0036E113F5